MADINRPDPTYTISVSSYAPTAGDMTVWSLRDLARALDEQGIPDTATVTCEHNHSTQHLVRLRVRHTVTITPPQVGTDG